MYGWRLWCCSFIAVQNDWNLVQPPCPRQPVPVLLFSEWKSVSWCSEGTSCVSVCAHCHWAPLKRDSLHFLCTFPSVSLHTLIRSSRIFTRLNSPSSLSLLECEMLQSLNHLCGPLLDSLHYVHPSFLLGRQKLDTAVQAWPHLCWADGRDHHSWPAGNTSAQAAQELVLLTARAYLVDHRCSTWYLPGPFLQSCFPVCTGACGYSFSGAGLGT